MKYRFTLDLWGNFVLQVQRDSGEWEFADSVTAVVAAGILNQEQITL